MLSVEEAVTRWAARGPAVAAPSQNPREPLWGELTPEEKALVAALPIGVANARPSRDLERVSGLDNRGLREALARLVDKGIPVGSGTVAGQSGFWLCEDADDYAVAEAHLRKLALAVLRRRSRLRKVKRLTFGGRQVAFRWPT